MLYSFLNESRLLGEKKILLPIAEYGRREEGISRNTLNQFKASETRTPRRKNETREEILKQDQWSHCLKKRKTLFSWEGVNYLFTNTCWDIENTHMINQCKVKKNTVGIQRWNSKVLVSSQILLTYHRASRKWQWSSKRNGHFQVWNIWRKGACGADGEIFI